MPTIVNGKVVQSDAGFKSSAGSGLADRLRNSLPRGDDVDSPETNASILKKVGVDLDTVLSPSKKKKRGTQLRGEPGLNTLLGE